MAWDLLSVWSAMNEKACLLSALILSACGPAMEMIDPDPGLASSVRAIRTPQGKTPQGKTPQGKTPQGTEANNPWLVVTHSFQIRGSNDLLVDAVAQLNGSRLQGIAIPGGQALPVPPLSPGLEQVRTRGGYPPVVWYDPTLPLATFLVREIQSPRMLGVPFHPGPPREARIMGSFVDSGPYGPMDAANLLQPQYRSATHPNADVRFYQVQIKNSAGNWVDFCATEAGSPPNAAMFLPRYIDPAGRAYSAPEFLGIACHDGTAVKCARWGYKAWTSLTPAGSSTPVSLEPYWSACYQAAMANYCEDGITHTEPDTLIDIWDRHHFIAPIPEGASFTEPYGANGPVAFTTEAAFNEQGTVCLEKERFAALPAVCGSQQVLVTGNEYCNDGNLPPGTWSSCGPKGLVGPARVFNKGELQGCVQQAEAAQDVPLVFVANWTNGCRHSPYSAGVALANDCNWLTRAVCELPGYGSCCGETPDGRMLPGKWDARCVAKANDLSLSGPIRVPPTGGVSTP